MPLVQHATSNPGTTATSITLTLPAGTTAGNAVVACVVTRASGTWSLPSGWTLLAEGSYGSSVVEKILWAVRANVPAGETSYVFSLTGASANAILGWVAEYSGPLTSSPGDVTAVNGSGTTTTGVDSTATATTAQADELVLAGIGFGTNSDTLTTDSTGYTRRAFVQTSAGNWLSIVVEEKIVSATGAQRYQGTQSVAHSYAAAVVTLKLAGGVTTGNVSATDTLTVSETIALTGQHTDTDPALAPMEVLAGWGPQFADTALTLSETLVALGTALTDVALGPGESLTLAGSAQGVDTALVLQEEVRPTGASVSVAVSLTLAELLTRAASGTHTDTLGVTETLLGAGVLQAADPALFPVESVSWASGVNVLVLTDVPLVPVETGALAGGLADTTALSASEVLALASYTATTETASLGETRSLVGMLLLVDLVPPLTEAVSVTVSAGAPVPVPSLTVRVIARDGRVDGLTRDGRPDTLARDGQVTSVAR